MTDGKPTQGADASPTVGDSIEGTLEKIVFQNPDNHWTVARLAPDDGGAAIAVVGSLFGVQVGTPLTLSGQWVNDPKFGKQFKAVSYRTKSPETLLGIERFIGSGLIPGIGPELAKRIVSHFGLKTLELIEKDPTKLELVDGIGPSRAKSIAAAWIEQRDIQDVMVFLRGHGVSTAFAVRIFKRYGTDAIGIIRQNPYRLALDIWGIGFRTADQIAKNLGLDPQAPARLEAGVVHVLGQMGEDGHLHVPQAHLVEVTTDLLDVAPEHLLPAIDRLRGSNLVIRETLGERGECLSLMSLWESERDAAAAFAALARGPLAVHDINIDDELRRFERDTKVVLAPAQRSAISASVSSKCLVITGGPGVGKTTIVRAIVSLFKRSSQRVLLAAPTGRAAKRLAESTGEEAQTIHRLLEFQPASATFERGADHPLEADLVIVDEASMIDTELFRALVTAIPETAQLILVGDTDQLPSVGPGSVLADVIDSEAAAVVRLTEIFRQAQESQIITSAHQVNRGHVPELAPPRGDAPDRSDFYFIERADPQMAVATILELVAERMPKSFGLDPVTDIQVLTPMHRGALGTQALNTALQERLNPPRKSAVEIRRGTRSFRVGDKVMQIRNDYDKDVFNGDIGVITRVTEDGEGLVVELSDGRHIEYSREDLDELAHAFAISVHKSQGSEYPAIVLPITTQHYMMLQRNLLYTAITRGKRLVVLVGTARAVRMAVDNHSTRRRWTWLAERIRHVQ